jgi:hypothetical protein
MCGRGPEVRAIGWLDGEHRFARGPVPPAFRSALEEHLTHAWQFVRFMGAHRCTVCSLIVRIFGRGGHANLWVPTEKHLFIAPAMILHYVGWHGYCPPEPFIEAVLACPPQGSEAYFERMRAFRHCIPNGRFPNEEQEL